MTLDDVTENGHSEWPGRTLFEGISESIQQSKHREKMTLQSQLKDEHGN